MALFHFSPTRLLISEKSATCTIKWSYMIIWQVRVFQLPTYYCFHYIPCGLECCPGRNRPETPLGGSPDFLAKSLVIPAIAHKFKLEFRKYGWNYQ